MNFPFRKPFALVMMLVAAPAATSTAAAAEMQHGVPQSLDDWARGAQLFTGLGSFHRAADTADPLAQAYFDQGMRLLWAFNHDEAARSFARAAQADPACAMCFWGVALTLGPNYNMPLMAATRAKIGWQAIGRAQALAAHAPAADRALIAALARRFNGPAPLDPANSAPVLKAYADAMREVAHRFPNDIDIQVLFAEAMMNLDPWKLWNADGSPAPGTAEIVATLKAAIAHAPEHPGANHYFIHAVEASNDPGQAIVSAERVAAAMPAAGHLVHMPSHIMQRVGRYEESAAANRRAVAADRAYYAKTTPIDYYPMYSAHNLQFLAAAAAMKGRRAETLSALRQVRTIAPDDMVAGMPGTDWSIAALYDAMIRFGEWDRILAEPAPDPRLAGMLLDYHAARATALAARHRIAEAKAELALTEPIMAKLPADASAGMNAAKPLYEIALLRARARIAAAGGNAPAAIALLSDAVRTEDALAYNEPPDEFLPTRHLLGAALLDAGKPTEAEAVYREDLRRNPDNGWALVGLANALGRQGATAAAETTRTRFALAWKNADIRIDRSAF